MNGREFAVCDAQKSLTAGDAQAVIEDAGQNRFFQPVQGRTGNLGAFQQGLDGAVPDGNNEILALQQEPCILHSIGQNRPQVILGISGQGFRFRGVLPLQREDPQIAGVPLCPVAPVVTFPEKIQERFFFREHRGKGIRIRSLVCHSCSAFLLYFLSRFSADRQ